MKGEIVSPYQFPFQTSPQCKTENIDETYPTPSNAMAF
jgi:hypothetical protein